MQSRRLCYNNEEVLLSCTLMPKAEWICSLHLYSKAIVEVNALLFCGKIHLYFYNSSWESHRLKGRIWG